MSHNLLLPTGMQGSRQKKTKNGEIALIHEEHACTGDYSLLIKTSVHKVPNGE